MYFYASFYFKTANKFVLILTRLVKKYIQVYKYEKYGLKFQSTQYHRNWITVANEVLIFFLNNRKNITESDFHASTHLWCNIAYL